MTILQNQAQAILPTYEMVIFMTIEAKLWFFMAYLESVAIKEGEIKNRQNHACLRSLWMAPYAERHFGGSIERLMKIALISVTPKSQSIAQLFLPEELSKIIEEMDLAHWAH